MTPAFAPFHSAGPLAGALSGGFDSRIPEARHDRNTFFGALLITHAAVDQVLDGPTVTSGLPLVKKNKLLPARAPNFGMAMSGPTE